MFLGMRRYGGVSMGDEGGIMWGKHLGDVGEHVEDRNMLFVRVMQNMHGKCV